MSKKSLHEDLNLLDIFCISTGAMISSGLFIIPGIAYAKAGPAVVLSYIIAGLFCLPTLFSMSELTTAMPKAGGAYYYIMRGFGPLFGTVAGFAMWFSLSLKGAFALVGMGTYLAMTTNIPMHLIATLCCVLFVVINLISTKEAGRIQVIIVVALLAILGIYVGYGVPFIESAKLTPFFSKGLGSVFSTASFVFISYGGLVKVAALAEETKKPSKTLPLGMILSLIVTSSIYALVVLVTVGVSDPTSLVSSPIPISDGARTIGGNFLGIIVTIGAFLAFISTANSGVMAASRYPLGMSRDRILPQYFQNIGSKGTPVQSILFTGLFMIIFIFLPLDKLVKVASGLLMVVYIFTNFTVILFRETKIQSYKPTFKSPFYPYMQILGILGGGLLLIEMGTFIVFLTMLFIILGILWYSFYVKKHVNRDSAMLYFLEQLVSKDKDLTSDNILNELKDIVVKRDEVVQDKVHQLFEDCVVLDIAEPVKMADFFKQISDDLGESLKLDPSDLLEKFTTREADMSTVIRKGLAIPHIIVDGEKVFKILIARGKTGIIFPDDKVVHTIFVTVGSHDQRHLHLKVLAAIAEIMQNPEFEKEWMEVANRDDLKHLILLAERKREKLYCDI